MILKYGCHYMQTEEAVRLNRKNGYGIKNGKYKTIFGNELFYSSGEELKFIKTCEKMHIYISNGPRIKYNLNNKEFFYFIDFESDKFLFEIKNSHIWYKNALESGEIEEKNKAATNFAQTINKKFIFLLDIKSYDEIIGELYAD